MYCMLVFVKLCIKGSGMDGQLIIIIIDVDVCLIRKLIQISN